MNGVSRESAGRGSGGHRVRSDVPFFACGIAIAASYLLLIAAFLAADAAKISPDHLLRALGDRNIRYSIVLSFITCTVSAILSVVVGIPTGYLLSRYRFPLRRLVDAMIDIPIILPPLVIGISLLILFQTAPGKWLDWCIVSAFDLSGLNALLAACGVAPVRRVTYEIPAVIIAQFAVAGAFAARALYVAFERIDPRPERVALTLGCRRSQAFFRVALPQARAGVVTALTLAWARSMGEFGPILVFAGTTRLKTEVLPTSVFLELMVGDIEAAIAVSLILVGLSLAVLVVARLFGLERLDGGGGV